MAEAKTGSINRFGARYGRTPKKRFGQIEVEQRKLHKCPYCNRIKVKRVTTGIWQCRKCDAKFTGKAYTFTKKKRVSVAPVVTETAEEDFDDVLDEDFDETSDAKEEEKEESKESEESDDIENTDETEESDEVEDTEEVKEDMEKEETKSEDMDSEVSEDNEPQQEEKPVEE